MQYFHINHNCKSEPEPVVLKVSEKALYLCGRMAKLIKQHSRLDRQLVQELAKINKIDEDEISDIMAEYDFLVDASQYGTGAEMAKPISKEEYEVLKNEHQ